MRPAHQLLALTLSLAACGDRKGFDQMNLRVMEVGDRPLDRIARPPTHAGEITTWRTNFPGQVFAAVKSEGPCPRDIHTVAGVQFKQDTIELCWTGTPRADPVPGFSCAREVYVQYEIMGVPAGVEPKFAFVGDCLPAGGGRNLGAPELAR